MPHEGHHTELQALQVEVLGAMRAAGDRTTQTVSPPQEVGTPTTTPCGAR